jgi:HEPN domain-containing protein
MPDKENLGNVRLDWYTRGEHDLRGAQILFREGGYTDTIAFLMEQSVEKYLKGYLINKGWRLIKTHDLELLITNAADYDKSFLQYLDYARTVSAFYIKQRYPPDPQLEYARKELDSLLMQTEKIIDLIKQDL